MNAEMNEGLNEDYRVGASVFDDESSFESDHEVETVESHDVTSSEPVAEPVEQPSEIVPIDQQRSEEQLKQARETLVKFYEQQPQAPMAEDEGSPQILAKTLLAIWDGWEKNFKSRMRILERRRKR